MSSPGPNLGYFDSRDMSDDAKAVLARCGADSEELHAEVVAALHGAHDEQYQREASMVGVSALLGALSGAVLTLLVVVVVAVVT